MQPFSLPSLPFDKNKMEPLFSSNQIDTHHKEHHGKYVSNLNKLVKGTTYKDKTLEELCDKGKGKIFNNAAQHWNHSFFWLSIREQYKDMDVPKDFADLEEDFVENGLTIFGSGWWWIAWHREDEAIRLYDTANAETLGQAEMGTYIPLLVADVWEHAYYVDYLSDRKKYLQQLWKQFNWDFAKENLERAKEKDEKWTR